MAKLADAADLKSAGLKRPVGVRFPLPAPSNLFVEPRLTFGVNGRELLSISLLEPQFCPNSAQVENFSIWPDSREI